MFLLFFCFWVVLADEFISKLYIIIVLSMFLSMILTYIAYEFLSYKIKKTKELLIKKDKKAKKQSAKLHLKNIQLENFLSGISHEFKNPISVIKISAQTIKNNPNINEELKNKFLDKIISNNDKINNILNRLRLGFGGDITPNFTQFDAKILCNEVIESLEEKYNNRNIILSGEKTLNADYDMIYQVVLNLCENALKYSNYDVKIILNKAGIFIKDNGDGINQNEIKLILKKFYKSKEYDWNNSLGLGLYIVKYILKLHNFEFFIKSSKIKGSIFGFKDR